MNFEEFINQIQNRVIRIMGEKVKVEVHRIVKNNSACLTGLTIMTENINISPTIYLNGYFKEFREGRDMDDITKEILTLYETSKKERNFDVENIKNFSFMKEKIVYKLINYDRNTELLSRAPHFRMLDLAIVFYCLLTPPDSREKEGDLRGESSLKYLSCEDSCNATIFIYNNLLKLWNVDTQELYSAAMVNTPRLLTWELKPMREIIRDISGHQEVHMIPVFSADMDEQNEPDIPDAVKSLNNVQKNKELKCIKAHDENLLLGKNKAGSCDNCGVDDSECRKAEEDIEEIPMYVLTNRMKSNGAACILYKGILNKIYEKLGQDYYVLPSSVHEVIVMPESEDYSMDLLAGMVTEINITQVSAQEILSDKVYIYRREDGCLAM